ncbi:protein of unknown function DUF450 [Sphaerobacter thermophilus DSM 20745]|uniref:Type I restriction enzyme R protein N-terminal domain-containing protein n=2 Tax=Sphaerobacter TaxID=2056 RepID=D1C6R5_SPHTD|nr:protein of unknown function DUF450 [Sphaerobacter thermophilus DSM 20745]
MLSMHDARDSIRRTLSELKTFLAQESVPRLSEADTKAYFIEPILAALGWVGIGVVRREYYVRNSQEFIDYVLFDPDSHGSQVRPVLAIEAKALQTELTEKNAAQLIQYCAVEGIEWAALTNARELQLFNTFLRPDLAAKRVMRLDLLAFNSDEEFEVLFEQLWQLSRESIKSPSIRDWLHQVRLDKAVRDAVLNPSSPVVKLLEQELAAVDIRTSPQELVQWFRTHLGTPVTRVPRRPQEAAAHVSPRYGSTDSGSATDHTRSTPSLSSASVGALWHIPASSPQNKGRYKHSYGVHLSDLVKSGVLPAGTPVILVGPRNKDLAHAEVSQDGHIIWGGKRYRSLSDRAFCAAFSPPRVSFNGWKHWYAVLPRGRVQLAELREEYLRAVADQKNVG